jgi:hypothetical protein
VIPSKLKDYLLSHSVASAEHSGASLWDHLVGVHRILQVVGSEDYVCSAGLFHSVYGTQSFKTVSVDAGKRHEVQELIGTPAEALVWAFCTLPRPALLESSLKQQSFDWADKLEGTTNANAKQFVQDLIRLECANLLEQKVLYKFPCLAQAAQGMRMLDREGFSV